MNESKLVLTHRLQREGRWNEATKFKESFVKELRKGGATRSESNDAGWEAMGEKYPPLKVAEPIIDMTPEEIAHLPPGSLEDFSADATWVYGNLVGEADVGSAPSAGAVGLLGWAKKHRNDFYGKILPKALQLQEKRPDTEKKKEQNLAHAQGLRERIGKSVG